jgi:hypothetical protein
VGGWRGRFDRGLGRRDEGLLAHRVFDAAVGVDQELDRDVASGGVAERVVEHRVVGGSDPLGGEGARHPEHQDVVLEAERPDALEPGVPGGVGELGPKLRRSLLPDPVCDVVGRRRRAVVIFHRHVHKCGELRGRPEASPLG